MSKIKSLPVLERPREKAYRYGIDKLSDHELIAILIGTGTVDNSALDIAYKLLMDNKGLFLLVQKPFSDLLSVKGIGKSKLIFLKLLAENLNTKDCAHVHTQNTYKKHTFFLLVLVSVVPEYHQLLDENQILRGKKQNYSC